MLGCKRAARVGRWGRDSHEPKHRFRAIRSEAALYPARDSSSADQTREPAARLLRARTRLGSPGHHRSAELPRETLLPCVRTDGEIIIISTYAFRSDWIRNLRKNPAVKVTCDGAVVPARAEVVEKLARKCEIVSEHPFVPAAPFKIVHAVALGRLRPVVVAGLRRWVSARPVVVIHTAIPVPSSPSARSLRGTGES